MGFNLNYMKKFVYILSISVLLGFSTFGETEPESSQVLSSTVGSGSDLDIDGNEELDALTDGLLLLRSMFGLSDSTLIEGVVADNAVYTSSEDIQARITSLGDKLDVDKDGSVDALSDGLIILRYLFGLTGDPLISGVISDNAERVQASDIEAYLLPLVTLGYIYTISGKTIDGYIKGATVFVDLNFNFKFDSGEISSITTDNGEFTISTSDEALFTCLKS